MNMFNDNDELKHPAFNDEKIEKKQMWSKIWDIVFGVSIVVGFIAWVLYCIWLVYTNIK